MHAMHEVPLWVKLTCAIALTVGTASGGWRIVRTLGRGIYRMRPLDGLISLAKYRRADWGEAEARAWWDAHPEARSGGHVA